MAEGGSVILANGRITIMGKKIDGDEHAEELKFLRWDRDRLIRRVVALTQELDEARSVGRRYYLEAMSTNGWSA